MHTLASSALEICQNGGMMWSIPTTSLNSVIGSVLTK
jgi:hypothetical protein